MVEKKYKNDRILFLIRGLAVLGAINCVVVPLFFTQQRPLFPLPGLYLIEIAVLGILGLAGLLFIVPYPPFWRGALWVAAGFLLAFVILGGFSIGFFLIPAMVTFLLAGFLMNRIEGDQVIKYIGLFLIAAVVQVILMMLAAGI
jgi:hypothetical protein